MQTKSLWTFLLLSLIFILTSCGQQEEETLSSSSSGVKRPVTISLGSYTTASYSPLDFLIPKSYAAVSDLKFCFKRLRFKKELEDTVDETVEDNIDLELGQVTISDSGTLLGTVEVPEDTYKRVEFDLEEDCDGTIKNSLDLINGSGSFSSTDRITIKFEGTFVVDGEENLELGVQNILSAANAYDGVGSLKDALEAVSGNL